MRMRSNERAIVEALYDDVLFSKKQSVVKVLNGKKE